MANVLLLRAPSNGQEDRYQTTFAEAGYQSISVPVLETISTNLPALKDTIRSGPRAENFDGVIITSARSCEVWKSAVGDLPKDSSVGTGEDSWSSTPFYVVGQATASALAEVREAYGQTPYTPEIICGESSGTGERLAQYIRELTLKPKRLLYLTGDKNRDTVPSMLEEAGIELRSLKVYETQGSRTFERDMKQVLSQNTGFALAFHRWWIVHFAPSAAEFVTPILGNHFNFESISPLKGPSICTPTPRVAAIGSVTAAFLQNELRIHVHVAPPKPTPQDLLAAIVGYDRDSAS
ncbi:hypothetical protein C0995_003584 [Termitomyces sp. Mi166|nr:hypothetical protein C0995_003584 [Termitomyces sp. Mi166\